MGKKKKKGSQRSKDFTIDDGLSSSGSGLSRESASTIPSYVVEGDKVKSNELERPTKDLVEDNARLNKECTDQEHPIADLEKDKRELRTKPTEDVQSDLELAKDKREALAEFKRNGDVNKGLMDNAQQMFLKKFPKESQDLVKLAISSFSWLNKPLNIDKIWDLMKSAHDLISNYISAEDFKKLMMETYKWFRGKFPGDQLRKEMQMDSEGYNRCIKHCTAKKVRALSKLIRSSNQREDISEKLVNMIILTRNLFRNYFPQTQFDKLLEKAHESFPKEFPPAPFYPNFTGMVAILERRESCVKDGESAVIIQDMLARLQDVATQFEWSERVDTQGLSNADYGLQFYHLCKYVARSDRVVFHKELVLEEVEANAREGKYKAGGHDVGSAVVGCFKSC